MSDISSVDNIDVIEVLWEFIDVNDRLFLSIITWYNHVGYNHVMATLYNLIVCFDLHTMKRVIICL